MEQVNDNNLSLYAMHDKIFIHLMENVMIKLLCMKELSPIDMLDLWSGKSDPTGNKVWMGALFFVEAMSKPIKADSKVEEATSIIDVESLKRMRSTLFGGKRVLELGAGTGASGISLLVGGHIEKDQRPQFLTFTDFDRNILDLCRQNCDINLSKIGWVDQSRFDSKESKSQDYQNLECSGYAVCSLPWGELTTQNHDDGNNRFLKESSYDTVIATDVLYDLSSLKPLLQSAKQLLRPNGYFVLAHVPRASVDYDSPIADTDTLEKIIINEAQQHGLSIMTASNQSTNCPMIIRPLNMIQIHQQKNGSIHNLNTLKEMDEVGASIMVFQMKIANDV